MDLIKEVAEHDEKMAKQVYVKDDHIILNVSYEYNILKADCDTPEKLLSWVYHLTEKTWMTTEAMRRFIEVACIENSITIPT